MTSQVLDNLAGHALGDTGHLRRHNDPPNGSLAPPDNRGLPARVRNRKDANAKFSALSPGLQIRTRRRYPTQPANSPDNAPECHNDDKHMYRQKSRIVMIINWPGNRGSGEGGST